MGCVVLRRGPAGVASFDCVDDALGSYGLLKSMPPVSPAFYADAVGW